ncbi:hypothetical protein CKM354_001271300 [Cercospora kikuchii]|uniref:RING-type domain-containing protein n=1 Tax=Cercospora kikuchii TaxID=84275 RepID=A0A9P3FMJ0_9PEZI|nr:uncharacterized protein CKM354_001271300 [Cercospora kikuchii]GIZ49686.1 hypothetical protein CKM354_001271300 [Cercospora kikuchii]
MPTRDEFLANPGLVPQDSESQCMICHETPAVEPVTTSGCECRVTYCRECIMEWFRSGSGKCTTCTVFLFDSECEDSENEDGQDQDYGDGYIRLDDGTEELGDEDEGNSSSEEEPPRPFYRWIRHNVFSRWYNRVFELESQSRFWSQWEVRSRGNI